MRKKNVNTVSQSSIKQYFPGFQDSDENEVPLKRGETPLNRYPSSKEQLSWNKHAKTQNYDLGQLQSEKVQKGRKIGTEIDKMEDWMADAYNKRKNHKQTYKNSTTNLDYSTVSIANDSALKLPAINTPLQHGNTNEQSKLVEQIRRVQNKIKELRFQRNLASNQQQKFQAMRPFIELQNQNMMNMQYMMMMAQGRGNEGHCCHHHNNPANNQPRVMYLPYPQMQSQYPPPYQHPYMDHQYPYPPQQKNQCQSIKLMKSKPSQKKNYNFQKIRKFRVAVIAVYFYLLFPKFANLFTKRRFKLHSEKYFVASEPHHSTIITKAFDILSEINYFQIAKTVEGHRKEKQIRRVAKAKTAKLVISEQYGQVKDYEIYLGDLEVFLLILLKKLHEIIKSGEFDSLIKEISVGNLPYSFPIDHSYLQEEMFRMKFHPQKTYLHCDQLQSKALILATFFVKLLAYDFLFVIREDMQWKQQLLKKNNLKKNQMIEAEMVATQMYISGILLHRYCMDILEQQMKENEGNVDKLDHKNIPIPMGMMIYESKDEVNTDKQLKKSGKKENKENSKKVNQFGEEYHLYEFEYIKKLAEFNNLMSQIIQKSGHNEEVKEKISDIIDEIYSKSIERRDLQYKEITSTVLSQNKNILKSGKEAINFEMPKRSIQEKNEIKELLKQIKQDKKRDSEGDGGMKKQNKKLTMKNIKIEDNKKKNNKSK